MTMHRLTGITLALVTTMVVAAYFAVESTSAARSTGDL